MVADVWEKVVWDFQAESGSSGSCPLFLHFLGKSAVFKKYQGRAPGSPRHPRLVEHRRGYSQRERASPGFLRRIASPLPCLARVATRIASLPALRDMGHSARRHLNGGRKKPINRKHINIFLTALVGQSSQGRTSTRPRDKRDKMAILLWN